MNKDRLDALMAELERQREVFWQVVQPPRAHVPSITHSVTVASSTHVFRPVLAEDDVMELVATARRTQHGLDPATLEWAAQYTLRRVQQAPEYMMQAYLVALDEMAVFLGAAAVRVRRGERPYPTTALAEVSLPAPEAGTDRTIQAVIDVLIGELERLQAAATPGEWFLSPLDGAWATRGDSPMMEAIASSMGRHGGVERVLGETDLSPENDSYAIACVNAVPRLLAEIARLRERR